jgi:ribosomal protein S18 acetylase RimI-like enzyme
MKPAIHFEKIIKTKSNEPITVRAEFTGAEEYIDFLRRSDLGKQYPKEDFQQRIAVLVENIQISLIARNKMSQIVGVCFGITDFAYWLFITDLGVDRSYEKQGLGRIMMDAAHELADGEKNIVVFAYANENAIPFYQKIGMNETRSMMKKDNTEYTDFIVE